MLGVLGVVECGIRASSSANIRRLCVMLVLVLSSRPTLYVVQGRVQG